MANPNDNAAQLRQLEAKIDQLANELNNVKGAAAGGNDEQVPEFDRNARGNLTRRGRAQQKKWVREQRKEAREEIRQEKRERLADRQAKFEETREESTLDNFAKESAETADLESVDTAGVDDMVNKMIEVPVNALDHFQEQITEPSAPVPDPTPASTDIATKENKGEKPAQVPSQPGLIKLQAKNEAGDCKLFEVIGSEDADATGCGGDLSSFDGTAITPWWQPSWSNKTSRVLAIAPGLNLIPNEPASSSQEFPQNFWYPHFTDEETVTLSAGTTTHVYVKLQWGTGSCDYSAGGGGRQAILAADQLMYEDGTGGGTGGSYSEESGDLTNYYYATGAPQWEIRPVTGSQPADTGTEKWQYLGSITLDGGGEVTSYKWRINHAFYWNHMSLVFGNYGATDLADGASPPAYGCPD